MAMSPRLDLRQGQSLVMTPQLQQAIKLLQLSNLEVAAYVESELEQNPLLEHEEAEGAGEPVSTETEGADPGVGNSSAADETRLLDPIDGAAAERGEGETPLDTDFGNLWMPEDGDAGGGGNGSGEAFANWGSGGGGGGNGFDDSDNGIEQTLVRETTLRDHLLGQLNVDIADPVDRIIGAHLIDLLDDAGYLTGELAGVAAKLDCDVTRVEASLAHLQRLDPPGVFARDLKECLALQLRDRNRFDPAMQALVENLALLAKRDMAALARICGVDAEDLAQMVTEIKALNPKPGLVFDAGVAQPVVPDVLMRPAQGGGWHVELNQDTLPRVLVNTRYYAKVTKEAKNKEEKEFIAERFHSANWLVKSLHQRAQTILKVATEIVRQQDAFFRRGVRYLRPLVLRDIATAISMHESTVSRVTTNKFLSAPHGVYELKYFFTSSISSSDGGEAHSAEAVRFRIKALVDAEAPDDVLSDDKLVDILKAEGIDIARRTVAKYREALRIASSVQRRREKSLGI
ncbi:MAG: RNA polymerase factor sigma-54 [Rhodospirillales bacterium]|nr:RNA polymerase factor sigma-54 [Rhodospirillales bacterium]